MESIYIKYDHLRKIFGLSCHYLSILNRWPKLNKSYRLEIGFVTNKNNSKDLYFCEKFCHYYGSF